MIQNKGSVNSPGTGLQLGSVDSGCCGETLEACLYRFQFATTPTTFSVVTIAGVAYDFVHTYSTPEALALALIEVLQAPVNAGGAGLAVHDGDIKVYLDSYATTADRLTIEIVSGVVFTNFITNVGTQTSATPICNEQAMCVHRLSYELTQPISLVIDNKALTLTTYATAALLRTAILAQITAQSLTGIVTAQVRTSATAGFADVVLYAKPGVLIYHDGDLIERGNCSGRYV